jgi:hypothetical protein
MKSLLFSIVFLGFAGMVTAQTVPFQLYLEPLSVPNLGGLQSYAFGQHNGKWLIFGGRLDGLHRRQPFATFDIAGHNNQILVVDPVAGQKWSASLSSLPVPLQEQLSGTNMEFEHKRSQFYCHMFYINEYLLYHYMMLIIHIYYKYVLNIYLIHRTFYF